jgi:hypothetical protein
MLAAKYLDDFYYRNEFYAKIGGIPKKDINALETHLVDALDFRLFIEETEFAAYLQRLTGYRAVNA